MRGQDVKQTKIWGTTERVYSVPGLAVDRLEILSGSFCSQHRHARKMNLFICQEGEVVIRCWAEGAEETAIVVYTLGPGQAAVVMPGIWHQFRSQTGAQVVELCLVAADVEQSEIDADIERRTEGGLE